MGGGGGNWVVLKEGGLREWNSVYGCVFGVWCVFVVGFVFEKTKPPFQHQKKQTSFLSFLGCWGGCVCFEYGKKRRWRGGGGGRSCICFCFLSSN